MACSRGLILIVLFATVGLPAINFGVLSASASFSESTLLPSQASSSTAFDIASAKPAFMKLSEATQQLLDKLRGMNIHSPDDSKEVLSQIGRIFSEISNYSAVSQRVLQREQRLNLVFRRFYVWEYATEPQDNVSKSRDQFYTTMKQFLQCPFKDKCYRRQNDLTKSVIEECYGRKRSASHLLNNSPLCVDSKIHIRQSGTSAATLQQAADTFDSAAAVELSLLYLVELPLCFSAANASKGDYNVGKFDVAVAPCLLRLDASVQTSKLTTLRRSATAKPLRTDSTTSEASQAQSQQVEKTFETNPSAPHTTTSSDVFTGYRRTAMKVVKQEGVFIRDSDNLLLVATWNDELAAKLYAMDLSQQIFAKQDLQQQIPLILAYLGQVFVAGTQTVVNLRVPRGMTSQHFNENGLTLGAALIKVIKEAANAFNSAESTAKHLQTSASRFPGHLDNLLKLVTRAPPKDYQKELKILQKHLSAIVNGLVDHATPVVDRFEKLSAMLFELIAIAQNSLSDSTSRYSEGAQVPTLLADSFKVHRMTIERGITELSLNVQNTGQPQATVLRHVPPDWQAAVIDLHNPFDKSGVLQLSSEVGRLFHAAAVSLFFREIQHTEKQYIANGLDKRDLFAVSDVSIAAQAQKLSDFVRRSLAKLQSFGVSKKRMEEFTAIMNNGCDVLAWVIKGDNTSAYYSQMVEVLSGVAKVTQGLREKPGEELVALLTALEGLAAKANAVASAIKLKYPGLYFPRGYSEATTKPLGATYAFEKYNLNLQRDLLPQSENRLKQKCEMVSQATNAANSELQMINAESLPPGLTPKLMDSLVMLLRTVGLHSLNWQNSMLQILTAAKIASTTLGSEIAKLGDVVRVAQVSLSNQSELAAELKETFVVAVKKRSQKIEAMAKACEDALESYLKLNERLITTGLKVFSPSYETTADKFHDLMREANKASSGPFKICQESSKQLEDERRLIQSTNHYTEALLAEIALDGTPDGRWDPQFVTGDK